MSQTERLSRLMRPGYLVPQASAYTQPIGNVSRHSGRPVATGPDGKPLWMRSQPNPKGAGRA